MSASTTRWTSAPLAGRWADGLSSSNGEMRYKYERLLFACTGKQDD